MKERRIALRYGVRGSTRVEKARVQNRYKDVSAWTRELRILASVPVISSFAVLLAVLMTGIFFLEEFCEHFYTGPGQKYVVSIFVLKGHASLYLYNIYRRLPQRLSMPSWFLISFRSSNLALSALLHGRTIPITLHMTRPSH